MRILLLLLLTVLSTPSHQLATWTVPAYQVAVSPGPYGGNRVWDIGSIQTIRFDTDFSEYNIELWQQLLFGSNALKSSHVVYTQSLGEVLPQSFNWTVSTYDLDIAKSPVFFFWLIQTNGTGQQTSAYFNITSKATTASGSSGTSTSLLSGTSIPTGKVDNNSTTTAASPPLPSVTSGGATPQGGSGGLSTGAQAGIGVGVSVSGLAAVVCASLLFWNMRKKQRRQGSKSDDGSSAEYSRPAADGPANTYQQYAYAEAPFYKSRQSGPVEMG